MEQLRKVHGQQMDRFRLQSANGSSTHDPLASARSAPAVTGVPGHQKAWSASQLPLDQYLKYLEKFQEDSTVLSTLAKHEQVPLSLAGAGGGGGQLLLS
jgi:hypothetical protein